MGFQLFLVKMHRLAGRDEEAAEALQRFLLLAEREYVPPVMMVLAFIAGGDFDNSIKWLERAFEIRSLQMPSLKVDPDYDPIRNDPRFQDILRRMKFPEN